MGGGEKEKSEKRSVVCKGCRNNAGITNGKSVLCLKGSTKHSTKANCIPIPKFCSHKRQGSSPSLLSVRGGKWMTSNKHEAPT